MVVTVSDLEECRVTNQLEPVNAKKISRVKNAMSASQIGIVYQKFKFRVQHTRIRAVNDKETKSELIAISRYNYPLCEECNCDPAGVPPTFFDDGGCANVAPGTLCTCKERVTGRICDTCKPLFWKLEANNPLGCTGKFANSFLIF